MKKILSLLLFCVALPAQAAMTPLAISIFPPVEFPFDNFSVTGVRASVLWGEHRDIYGIDLGLLGNITMLDFDGIAVSGLFDVTHGYTNIVALQFAGITNVNTAKTHIVGLQLSAAANVNEAESSLVGLGLSVANVMPYTKVYGFQVGLYNQALSLYGIQVGLINRVKNLHGIMIGLLNFNETGTFYVAPILNIGF